MVKVWSTIGTDFCFFLKKLLLGQAVLFYVHRIGLERCVSAYRSLPPPADERELILDTSRQSLKALLMSLLQKLYGNDLGR